MAGDDAPFTDEDAVMAAWTVVEPVLAAHRRRRWLARPGRRSADEMKRIAPCTTEVSANVPFLFDIDNTLPDCDRLVDGLRMHLKSGFGVGRAQRYGSIFDRLRVKRSTVRTTCAPSSVIGSRVDEKLHIRAAMNAIGGGRLTTVFTRQGHSALDPHEVGAYAASSFTIERIGELADHDLSPLITQRAGVGGTTQGGA